MKKIIVSLLICVLTIIQGSPLLAADNSVSIFKALSNFSQIGDYKLMQSFYGNLEFTEDSDHISADYRISISSVADNDINMNSFNRISIFLKLTNHSGVTEATPFKEMMLQTNGEIIGLDQKDIYFKLNNFNINLKEGLSFAVLDMENLKAMVDLYRGKWFHTSVKELLSESSYAENDKEINVDEYRMIEDQFKEDPKMAIMKLSELVLKDSDAPLSENETNDVLKGIELALTTKLFTERNIVAGKNNGFTFFNLNRSAIISLLEQFATLLGEEMTLSDTIMIRTALGKTSLSGIYRIENKYGLMDNLLIRFRLRETGPVNNLELNYRYKLSGINEDNHIKAPTVSEAWYGFQNNFDEESFQHEE